MSLYKYCPADTKILDGVFRDSSIFFKGYKHFNDPYESLLWIANSREERLLMREKNEQALDRVLTNRKVRISPQTRKKILKTHFVGRQELQKEVPDDFNERWGILCLTKDPYNIQMWSYYADAHKGFVFEFDENEPLFSKGQEIAYGESRLLHPELGRVLEVTYEDERRPVSLQGKAGIQEMLCRKAKGWAHEKEVRVVRNVEGLPRDSNGNSPIRFSPSSLTGIIFGDRCDQSIVDHAAAIYYSHKETYGNVKFYRAALERERFQITANEFRPQRVIRQTRPAP